MRGKSPLVIMELCVMLLVFAIAAALCLGCFAAAENISAGSRATDRACALAQGCAETLKAHGGDFSAAAGDMDARWDGESLSLERDGLLLSAREGESGHELMGLARLTVTDDKGLIIFAMDCAWQRGGPLNG